MSIETQIQNQRKQLDDILRSIDGVKKVYYQPPESMQLKYPCIIYEPSGQNVMYANDSRYLTFMEYTLTLIDRDPESIIQKSILDLRKNADANCYVKFDRFFTADNLNHWTYRLAFTKGMW